MGMATVPEMAFPIPFLSNFASETAMALTASTHKACFVFQAPKTGTITGASYKVGTVTASDTIDVRLENVSLTTGFADGTLANSGGTNDSNAADSSLTSNTWRSVTFTGSVSVTRGQWLALVVANGAGGGNFNVSRWTSSNIIFATARPAVALDSGSGYAAVSNGAALAAINYGGTYYNVSNFLPSVDGTAVITTRANTTSSKHHGARFTPPMACRASGAIFFCPAGSDITVSLWDSDGATKLANIDLDGNVVQSSGSIRVLFASPVELTAGTTYRLTIASTSGAAASLYSIDAASTAQMGAFRAGDVWSWTESTTHPPTQESHWSQTNTRYPLISLLIDGASDTTSGGGIRPRLRTIGG